MNIQMNAVVPRDAIEPLRGVGAQLDRGGWALDDVGRRQVPPVLLGLS